MRDFSTVLLINILRAIVNHSQESSEIDHRNAGFQEFRRTLLNQILRLEANDPVPERLTVDPMAEAHNGI
jgi:hypothetical protein